MGSFDPAHMSRKTQYGKPLLKPYEVLFFGGGLGVVLGFANDLCQNCYMEVFGYIYIYIERERGSLLEGY